MLSHFFYYSHTTRQRRWSDFAQQHTHAKSLIVALIMVGKDGLKPWGSPGRTADARGFKVQSSFSVAIFSNSMHIVRIIEKPW